MLRRTSISGGKDLVPRGVHAFLGQLVAATLLMAVSLARGAPSLPPRYVEGELLVKFKGGPLGP